MPNRLPRPESLRCDIRSLCQIDGDLGAMLDEATVLEETLRGEGMAAEAGLAALRAHLRLGRGAAQALIEFLESRL